MNRYIFTIGNFKLEWYSVLIIIGAMIGITMILKEAKRYKFSTDFVFNMLFWAIIFGIIGARVYYVLFNLELYDNFWDACKIWEGGLAIHGGIIAGALVIYLYCKKYKVRTIRMFDFIVPALILAQAIGRWGNFFNGEAHGGIVSRTFLENLHLPNFIIEGMHIGKYYYAPTYLYESVLNVIGFILLIIIRKFKKIKLGNITALYLIWYGIVRFIIESMRTDSLLLGNMKIAQLISIIMIIIGIIMLIVTSIKCDRYKNVEGGSNE